MSMRDEFDCTPQQYHAGLDKLWAALPGKPDDWPGESVYEKISAAIANLEHNLGVADDLAELVARGLAEVKVVGGEVCFRATEAGRDITLPPAAPAECATYFCEKCEGQGIVRVGVAPGQVVPCPACAPGAEEARP